MDGYTQAQYTVVMISGLRKTTVFVVLLAVAVVTITLQYVHSFFGTVVQKEHSSMALTQSCIDNGTDEKRDVLFVSCGGFF